MAMDFLVENRRFEKFFDVMGGYGADFISLMAEGPE